LHDPAPTKIVKNADKTEEKKPAQQPEKRSLEPSLPEWKCTAGEKLEVKKEDASRSLSSEQPGRSPSSWAEKRDAASQPGSYSNPEIVKCWPFNPHDSFFHT
jgi:hypothetical protein